MKNLNKCLGLALVAAFVLASSTNACDKKCSKSSATTAAAKSGTADGAKDAVGPASSDGEKHGGCHGAKTVADATVKTEGPASTEGAKSGCGGHGATTVATTSEGAKKDCASKCSKAGTAGGCCSKKGDKVKAAMASLPGMTYKVGELETGCIMTASAKAEETKSDIQFIVDGKSYAERDDANDALAALLTGRMAELTEVSFVAGDKTFKCPTSAGEAAKEAKTTVKYRLAGFDFDCKDKAATIAKKATEAADGVAIKYVSNGEAVMCPHAAKAEGKAVAFVVGEETTDCEHMAKLLLAQAKVKAIVETVASSL